MDQKIRRFHLPVFKVKVVLEALKEQKTLAELSSLLMRLPYTLTKQETNTG